MQGEKRFPKKHRTTPSAPRILTLQGGGAMDGGGAASPDAAICISPRARPIVVVAPAEISKGLFSSVYVAGLALRPIPG
jgi:hypothetical protein